MTTRSLSLAAVALLACASQQKTSQAAATASRESEERATVIQPSSMSPEQVRLLQRSLIDRGFAVDLSGRFDQPTQTALSQFQRARGLPATGNLNAPTIDALGMDPRDVMPVRGDSGPGAGTSSGHSTTAVPAPAPGMAPPSTPPAPPTSTMPPDAPGTPTAPTDTSGTSTPVSPSTPPGGPGSARPGY